MKNIFKGLVSPISGVALKEIDGYLVATNGSETFEIKNGVACLCDHEALSELKRHEMRLFDQLNLQKISYFNASLFNLVAQRIASPINLLSNHFKKEVKIVELGGGQGHWAQYIKEKFTSAQVFLCDLSFNSLERAPQDLIRVCADVAQKIFEKESVSIACFWVSLHHLESDEIEKALKEVFESLQTGGVLLVFEPNKDFYLRQVMYRSPLKNDVYFDDQEKGLDFMDLSKKMREIGFQELETIYLNPSYSTHFIKKLKKWCFYFVAVQFLYYFDKWLADPLCSFFKCPKAKRYFSLYGLSLHKK